MSGGSRPLRPISRASGSAISWSSPLATPEGAHEYRPRNGRTTASGGSCLAASRARRTWTRRRSGRTKEQTGAPTRTGSRSTSSDHMRTSRSDSGSSCLTLAAEKLRMSAINRGHGYLAPIAGSALLESVLEVEAELPVIPLPEIAQRFSQEIENSGLVLPEERAVACLAALMAKPFAIFTGLSGLGKDAARSPARRLVRRGRQRSSTSGRRRETGLDRSGSALRLRRRVAAAIS